MTNNIQDTVDSLNDLLDEERVALLDGNLDLIGRMLKRKETLIDSLNDLAKADTKVISDINTKVVRNQLLLESALEGIKSVADRLTSMRQVKNSLDTVRCENTRKRQSKSILIFFFSLILRQTDRW